MSGYYKKIHRYSAKISTSAANPAINAICTICANYDSRFKAKAISKNVVARPKIKNHDIWVNQKYLENKNVKLSGQLKVTFINFNVVSYLSWESDKATQMVQKTFLSSYINENSQLYWT